MDAYERLEIPRTLKLSDEDLRAAFREAGRKAHPDAGGGEAEFSQVQAAFVLLSSPSRRLKHWLELEGSEGDSRGTISTGLMDLFGRIGQILQEADGLTRRREEARSALVAAMLEGEVQACREAIEGGITAVDGRIAEEVAGFSEIETGAISREEAGERARNLAFLEKWRASLRERFARLV